MDLILTSGNFANKKLLLEAEREYAVGNFDQADALYLKAIASSKEHRFIHEEAIS